MLVQAEVSFLSVTHVASPPCLSGAVSRSRTKPKASWSASSMYNGLTSLSHPSNERTTGRHQSQVIDTALVFVLYAPMLLPPDTCVRYPTPPTRNPTSQYNQPHKSFISNTDRVLPDTRRRNNRRVLCERERHQREMLIAFECWWLLYWTSHKQLLQIPLHHNNNNNTNHLETESLGTLTHILT